jgi:hypothetical protein
VADATCVRCGAVFQPKPQRGSPQTYCTASCRNNGKHGKRPARDCEVCGLSFSPRTSLYAKRCDWCRKPVQACPVVYANCGQCDALYVKRGNRVHCLKPRDPERAKVYRAMTWKPKPRVTVPCATCAVPIPGSIRTPHPTYCSKACRKQAPGFRAQRRRDKDIRKARKRGASVEPIYRARVFERDGWKCGVCHKRVPRTATVPHPLAPTLDHIIPLAGGGSHTYANVQLAHFICNSRKSVGAGQLRLDLAA